MDDEGEINGTWRDMGIKGMWYMMGKFFKEFWSFLNQLVPGNLALCRFYSKHLALRK
jgi:hypothetical protein